MHLFCLCDQGIPETAKKVFSSLNNRAYRSISGIGNDSPSSTSSGSPRNGLSPPSSAGLTAKNKEAVNKQSKQLKCALANIIDRYGQTPLHFAVRGGSADVVELLVRFVTLVTPCMGVHV